ncbi:cupin domain-containing protein [Ferrimonas sp. YFM]|uniref:cupin domain-containing protein n=1 Tax=Ferrimonas sp. YFM TaxID=3028878 RepID=UPI002574797F|nr:cupin domain-containing protein [Ferrimonas sp. YFM]BDY06951.1 cupin [Ferrimonas sp. YFM]
MQPLNMAFDKPLVIDTQALTWQASPAPGVWRKRLECVAEERGHVTSLVRYDPGSAFPNHGHPAGEELLVLEGVFSDESGHFGAGSYLRNPPGSGHAPASEPGCVLLVKLCQFADDDGQSLVIPGLFGAPSRELHRHGSERVSWFRLNPGEGLPAQPFSCEFFLVDGLLEAPGHRLSRGHWCRFPAGLCPPLRAEAPSLVWLKAGHF